MPKVEITEKVVSEYSKNGSMRATAQILGIHRRSVERHLRKAGLLKKPLAGGKQHAQADRSELPKDRGNQTLCFDFCSK